MRRPLALTLAIVAVALPAALAAQQGIAERLAGRVPASIDSLVRQLAGAAAARGLPVEPLIQKAIEGSAKRIPADRVALALRVVAAQLDTAEAALVTSDTIAIAAGSFALTAGLHGAEIAAVARSARAAADIPIALRVAGTLAALGVPPGETVSLVEASLRSGRAPVDLLTLPARVQSEIARGATPAQAAGALARTAGAQGRRGAGGPPPGRGPSDHPAHPPHPPHP